MNNEPVALKVVKGEICYLSDEDDQSYGFWCPISYDTEHKYLEGTKFYTHPVKEPTDDVAKYHYNKGHEDGRKFATVKELTDEDIRNIWASENGLEDMDMCKFDNFLQTFRFVEQAILRKAQEK